MQYYEYKRMNILNNDAAFLPVKEIVNRRERRLFTKEALSIIEDLEKINTSFLFYLFEETDPRSYLDLYRYYSDLWIQKIDEIAKCRKLKFILLDRTWFVNNYAPDKLILY